MSRRTLFGLETEYALARRGRDPWVRGRVCDLLMSQARSRVPHLPGGSGLFLGNGARFYIDRGEHPEYATPECEDPWQAVGYAKAGDRFLLELLRDAARCSTMMANTAVFRAPVDYTRRGITWGCHESYLHTSDPSTLPPAMLPHLVTRAIYAGAGGFHPTAPGLEFTLSPRAWLLSDAVSGSTTHGRGIFNTRNESLSGLRWRRMHVIAGESLCTDRGAVLKLGTTALVLAASEAGGQIGRGLALASPVEALRTIVADASLAARVGLADGGSLTALAIQRAHLEMVERCLRHGGLPEWAGDLCVLWRETLDGLERRDPAILRQLDWGLKRELYRARAARAGIAWEALPVWSGVLRRLERVAARIFEGEAPPVQEMLRDHSRFCRELHRVTPVLRGGGMEWTDVRALVRLRHELLETDLRFGELGPSGLYDQLEAQAVARSLARRPVPAARALVTEPPAGGRAGLRGHTINELWGTGKGHHYIADWASIVGPPARGRLDLSDPFTERAAWIGPDQIAGIVARVMGAGS